MRNFQKIADEIIKVIDEECDFDEERITNIIEQIEKVRKGVMQDGKNRMWNVCKN